MEMQQQQKQKSILFLIFMVSIRKFPIIFCSLRSQKKSKISGRIWNFQGYQKIKFEIRKNEIKQATVNSKKSSCAKQRKQCSIF